MRLAKIHRGGSSPVGGEGFSAQVSLAETLADSGGLFTGREVGGCAGGIERLGQNGRWTTEVGRRVAVAELTSAKPKQRL